MISQLHAYIHNQRWHQSTLTIHPNNTHKLKAPIHSPKKTTLSIQPWVIFQPNNLSTTIRRNPPYFSRSFSPPPTWEEPWAKTTKFLFEEIHSCSSKSLSPLPTWRSFGQKPPNVLQQCLFIRIVLQWTRITHYFFNKQHFSFYDN